MNDAAHTPLMQWRGLWILIAVTLAIYLPTVWFGYIGLDDPVYVRDNPHVLAGLNTQTFVWAWTTTWFGFYHPLTWLSHLLDVTLFGNRPGAFHGINALIHLLNVLLCWRVCTRLTGDEKRSFWVALLWAVHPLRVESVAWIAERKDALCGLFSLSALWFYANWAQRRRWRDYVGVTVMLALALLSKPMAVTLPCVMLLLDVWPLKRLKTSAFLEKMPWLAMAITLAVVTLVAKLHTGETVNLHQASWGLRIATMLWGDGRYLGMIVWPVGLYVPYLLTVHPLWQTLTSSIVLLSVTAWCVMRRKDKPYLLMGWLWFIGMLLPVSGLLQTGQQSHADRFTYLPMIGLLIAAVWWCSDRLPNVRVGKVIAIAIVVVFTGLSTRQVQYWHNSVTLFEHVLEMSAENPMAHRQLGITYANRGDWPRSAKHLLATLKHLPDDASLRRHASEACMKAGRLPDAIEQLQWLAAHDPTAASPHMNLALVYLEQGDKPRAVAQLREAIRRNPQWKQPRELLGKLVPSE